MKIKALTIPFLFLAFCGCNNLKEPSTVSAFEIAEEAIDSIINDLVLNHQVPGYTISVISKDSVVFSKSYGYSDLKLKKKVENETLFQIGSITKSFTAIALMQLYDEGKFDPNVPLSEYLEWFNINDNNPAVTGHHLLTHTSGINAGNDEIYSSPAMGVMTGQLDSSWEPGEKFHYSNRAYSVLHLLIEHLSGISYREYIQQKILQPLGMTSTRVGIRMDSREIQAIGYVYPFDDRPHHPSRALVEANFFEYGIADGCIQSTATDMTKYMQMLINNGMFLNKRIISEEAFDLFAGLSSPHPSNQWYQYGIDITQNNKEIQLSHSGGMIGFSANMIVDITNEIGVFIATNTQYGSVHQVANYIMQATKSVFEGEKLPEYEFKTLSSSMALDHYVGEYVGRNGKKIKVLNEFDSLIVEADDQRIHLSQIDSAKFYTPEQGFDLYYWTFMINENSDWFQLVYGEQVFLPSTIGQRIDNSFREEWKEYTGKYRSYSPWFSYFEVIQLEGELKLILGYGSEVGLIEMSKTKFKIGASDSPEFIEFVKERSGHSLKANVSGHTFYWIGS